VGLGLRRIILPVALGLAGFGAAFALVRATQTGNRPVFVPAQAFVAQHLATYKEYLPRQRPGSFTLDRVLESLHGAGSRE
jgi:hypothetical protein